MCLVALLLMNIRPTLVINSNVLGIKLFLKNPLAFINFKKTASAFKIGAAFRPTTGRCSFATSSVASVSSHGRPRAAQIFVKRVGRDSKVTALSDLRHSKRREDRGEGGTVLAAKRNRTDGNIMAAGDAKRQNEHAEIFSATRLAGGDSITTFCNILMVRFRILVLECVPISIFFESGIL